MSLYVFLDGPLAGEVLDSSDPHTHGERIDVGVIDVCQAADDLPSHGYAVQTQARRGRPGVLRYLGASAT